MQCCPRAPMAMAGRRRNIIKNAIVSPASLPETESLEKYRNLLEAILGGEVPEIPESMRPTWHRMKRLQAVGPHAISRNTEGGSLPSGIFVLLGQLSFL